MRGMVFIKILCRLTIGGLCILLFSCTTYRTLYIEVMEPAKVQLKPGGRMALIDRNIQYGKPIHHLFSNQEGVGRGDVYVQFARGISSVFSAVSPSDSLLPLAVEKATKWKKDVFPAQIIKDSVRSLCRKFGLDYLISIEMQYYNADREKLNNNWFIRLYESDGKVIDTMLLTHQMRWKEWGEEEFEYLILGGAWDKGAEYGRRIIPYWEETERRVYHSGNILRLGDAYFRDGKIDEAIKVWSGAMQLSPKTALRAAVNLAWIYENAGDFEGALNLLEEVRTGTKNKKINERDKEYLDQYIQVIRQRIEKGKILDQQIVPE